MKLPNLLYIPYKNLSSNSPMISEKKVFRYVCVRPKCVALDERSKVSLTFCAYIKPVFHF